MDKFDERLREERVILLKSSKNVETGTVFRTFLVRFPKILLAELNTHRMLVRNCGSSRAIPTKTFIKNIAKDPYIPMFTALRAGMTGAKLDKDDWRLKAANMLWATSRFCSVTVSKVYHKLGIHKQNANRVLEPYTYVDLVLSGTEWDNLLHLRCAEDAQPDFKVIADKIKQLIQTDNPSLLRPGEWHIPFMDDFYQLLSLDDNIKVAIARIARVSYMRHGSTDIELQKDIKLATDLVGSGHLSPLEHVAMCVPSHLQMTQGTALSCLDHIDSKLHKFLFYDRSGGCFRWTRNYAGFYTYRHAVEDGKNIV